MNPRYRIGFESARAEGPDLAWVIKPFYVYNSLIPSNSFGISWFIFSIELVEENSSNISECDKR